MKRSFIQLYIGVICTITWHANGISDQDLKLHLVQIIFRHGKRSPLKEEAILFNITDASIYNVDEFGLLTKIGKNDSYNLGCSLRTKYDKFLGRFDNPNHVYGMSSKTVRTTNSMQLFLACFFPVSLENHWNPRLNWRPTPFHQAIEELDELFINTFASKKFLEKLKIVFENSEYFTNQIAKYTDLVIFLEGKIGFKLTPFGIAFSLPYLWHILEYHIEYGIPRPDWATEDLVKPLLEIIKICLRVSVSTPELKKLNGGLLIKEQLKNMNNSKYTKKPKKIYLYASHDLTLDAFLRHHNINKTFSIPAPSSAIITEKYIDANEMEYIRMLYLDGQYKNYTQLRIGDCEVFCPMKKYLKIVEDVVPTDEEIKVLLS